MNRANVIGTEKSIEGAIMMAVGLFITAWVISAGWKRGQK
jgi:uncharacterized membrane protein (DUF485 family)